jgi:hypothetical protein
MDCFTEMFLKLNYAKNGQERNDRFIKNNESLLVRVVFLLMKNK